MLKFVQFLQNFWNFERFIDLPVLLSCNMLKNGHNARFLKYVWPFFNILYERRILVIWRRKYYLMMQYHLLYLLCKVAEKIPNNYFHILKRQAFNHLVHDLILKSGRWPFDQKISAFMYLFYIYTMQKYPNGKFIFAFLVSKVLGFFLLCITMHR